MPATERVILRFNPRELTEPEFPHQVHSQLEPCIVIGPLPHHGQRIM